MNRWSVCPDCGDRMQGSSKRCRSCADRDRRRVEAATFESRFWSRVDASGDCWEWTGSVVRTPNGAAYGRASVPLKGVQKAHRIAYELLVGPIPDGLTLDHICRNTTCVNPDHLEPVTGLENVRRGAANGMALGPRFLRCKSGRHELTAGNVYVSAKGRACRACHIEKGRSYRRAIAAATTVPDCWQPGICG